MVTVTTKHTTEIHTPETLLVTSTIDKDQDHIQMIEEIMTIETDPDTTTMQILLKTRLIKMRKTISLQISKCLD